MLLIAAEGRAGEATDEARSMSRGSERRDVEATGVFSSTCMLSGSSAGDGWPLMCDAFVFEFLRLVGLFEGVGEARPNVSTLESSERGRGTYRDEVVFRDKGTEAAS